MLPQRRGRNHSKEMAGLAAALIATICGLHHDRRRRRRRLRIGSVTLVHSGLAHWPTYDEAGAHISRASCVSQL